MSTTTAIPQATLREVTPGIEQPEDAIADALCQRRTDATKLEGDLPFLTNEMTIRRGLNRDLEPGEEIKAGRGDFGTISFSAKKQAGRFDLYYEKQVDASYFEVDLVAHWVGEARKDANTATDLKFADVLRSTTLNLEWDADTDGNGEWDDLANGTPQQDMVDISDQVPHANMAIIGRGVASALRKQIAFHGQDFYFDSGGVVTLNSVRRQVGDIFTIDPERVHVLDERTFNQAALGEDYDLGFIGNDVFWVGTDYDLQMVDPDHEKNRYAEQDHVAGIGDIITYIRFVDICRNVVENGLTVSNALT
ncbi:MAG: hypothetical protein FKY71_08925 [Spiribacter salinus]|uniref:Phage major capsid protein n=1 Tax=Spiribacter salinus TaxID=1335746 RepID=A0A540VTB2_9GAMM|nr:MAG: hypothetical protein FKY71_08925 [Spiribacter salinus]